MLPTLQRGGRLYFDSLAAIKEIEAISLHPGCRIDYMEGTTEPDLDDTHLKFKSLAAHYIGSVKSTQNP